MHLSSKVWHLLGKCGRVSNVARSLRRFENTWQLENSGDIWEGLGRFGKYGESVAEIRKSTPRAVFDLERCPHTTSRGIPFYQTSYPKCSLGNASMIEFGIFPIKSRPTCRRVS